MIHGLSYSNWNPGCPIRKCAGKCSVNPRVTSDVSSAIHAETFPRSGITAIRIAPASGTSRMSVRIDWFKSFMLIALIHG